MINQFMKETGFTIRELAVIFGISHSLIGHVLKGNRSLPTAVLVQFIRLRSEWQAFYESDCKEAIPVTATRCRIKQQATLFLEQEVSAASFEVARINRLLEHQQKRYRKLEAKLQFILLQRKHCRDEGLSLFLKVRENDILQSMNHCCPEKQEMTRYRLALAKQRERLARNTARNVAL